MHHAVTGRGGKLFGMTIGVYGCARGCVFANKVLSLLIPTFQQLDGESAFDSGREGRPLLQYCMRADVRFASLSDMAAHFVDVGYTHESVHRLGRAECPSSAISDIALNRSARQGSECSLVPIS